MVAATARRDTVAITLRVMNFPHAEREDYGYDKRQSRCIQETRKIRDIRKDNNSYGPNIQTSFFAYFDIFWQPPLYKN